MFPIFNLTGNPIGFQSRRINDALTKIPKYCNSDNNELFCKGSIIFGLYQARGAIYREDKVYWVEAVSYTHLYRSEIELVRNSSYLSEIASMK